MSRDDASQRQVLAANPARSTWLSANAGSGKTRVLTDRVARLLLDGTRPQHILCLTYTKAAAGEMQNRLFRRLGSWAMLPDDDLRLAIQTLGVDGELTEQRLRRARTLFASAIEAPGGLKIQTIHSFCAAILRRFPMEAGVSPQFTEMEDKATSLLADDLLEELANGPDRSLVDDLARYANDLSLPRLTQLVVSKRTLFAKIPTSEELFGALGLPADFDAQALHEMVFLGGEADLLARIGRRLAESSPSDQTAAGKLARISTLNTDTLPDLESVFLFASGQRAFTAKIGSFPTKGGRALIGEDLDALEAFMLRVENARALRLAHAAARKTKVLHRFAEAFLPRLEQRKQERGWLDFDDLIERTRRLLRDPDVAEWVLFRLDGGIDHILVDEAQDTSPAQWDVIESLAREFSSGEGARADVTRTLFVVGDKKQSIYSFQGAEPDSFDQMEREFGSRFSNAESGFQSLTLEYSFRSSAAILNLVDSVFAETGTMPLVRGSRHMAFKDSMPGRVDLWPAVEPEKDEDDRHWTDPVDKPGRRHHTVILAERIAGAIRDMIDGSQSLPDGDGRRPLKAGDILILLQSRTSGLFEEIVRACKALELPIAGPDRLRVGAELAVRDLLAVLKFLVTPEDNLSLAEALRSPLFGWDEQALFDLAHRRTEPFLWQALRAASQSHAPTLDVLNDLRSQADFLRPHEMLERILTRHRGRKRLLARLGPEAADGIDALLSQALVYEQSEAPSLTGFLSWVESDNLEIKRQTDSGGDLIRIMTVHGAKGLEAPVVILPDTAVRRPPPDPEIELVGKVPFWRVPAKEMPQPLLEARQVRMAAAAAERARLQYVALTRAESWLIVAAAGKTGDPGQSWYSDVQAAMTQTGARPEEMPGGSGLRLDHLDWTAGPLGDSAAPAPEIAPLPDLFGTTAPAAPAVPAVMAASDLGGAKALPSDTGLSSDAATERGTYIHLLLEHLPNLPEDAWPEATKNLVPDSSFAGLLSEVAPILHNPELAFLFSAETLAEVPAVGSWKEYTLHGIMDRIIPGPEKVLVVDFKSNAVVPDRPENCPEGILRQLGAYAQILGQVYPGRTIETAVLWTTNGRLMRFPHTTVMDALSRAPLP